MVIIMTLDILILLVLVACGGCFVVAALVGLKVIKTFKKDKMKGKVVSIRYGKYDLSKEDFKDKLIDDILNDNDDKQ